MNKERNKSTNPNPGKAWRVNPQGFTIRLGGERLKFDMSHHARRRSVERGITFKSIATTLLRVRDQIEGAIASKGQHPKVAIADYSSGAALIIALEANGGKIITVLEYPLMILPDDLRIIDHRIDPKTFLPSN